MKNFCAMCQNLLLFIRQSMYKMLLYLVGIGPGKEQLCWTLFKFLLFV